MKLNPKRTPTNMLITTHQRNEINKINKGLANIRAKKMWNKNIDVITSDDLKLKQHYPLGHVEIIGIDNAQPGGDKSAMVISQGFYSIECEQRHLPANPKKVKGIQKIETLAISPDTLKKLFGESIIITDK